MFPYGPLVCVVCGVELHDHGSFFCSPQCEIAGEAPNGDARTDSLRSTSISAEDLVALAGEAPSFTLRPGEVLDVSEALRSATLFHGTERRYMARILLEGGAYVVVAVDLAAQVVFADGEKWAIVRWRGELYGVLAEDYWPMAGDS